MSEKTKDRQVTREGTHTRLDRCLRLWIPQLPQVLIEKAARKGQLRVDGKKTKPSLRVQEGQTISFPVSFLDLEEKTEKKIPQALTQAEKKWIKSLILYEDTEIIVLNKPRGIAVQRGTKQHRALDWMMEAYDSSSKPRLVHRLDKDTSGLLVFAKTLPMARALTQAFKERKVQKVYWALVAGVPARKEGIVSLSLSKKQDPFGEKVRVDDFEGVRASSFYHVREALGKKVALLELVPKTGRTHQLRVHCAEGLKTPIIGDGKYGGEKAALLGSKPLLLHAKMISLPLANGKVRTFEAPLPRDFEETCKDLGITCV